MKAAGRKRYDLVLVHGLLNMHRWSRRFLDRCVEHWGSGRVYVVYLNPSMDIWRKRLPRGAVTFIGRNDFTGGTQAVDVQAQYLAAKVAALRRRCGLSRPFSVIAHSMGGIVARRYMAVYPEEVAALVTLGTPHHGSPLAEDYRWLGILLRAQGALANLTPSWLARFNQAHPPGRHGPVYTVRGCGRLGLNWGVLGELLAGGVHLRWRYGTRSDGLVPEASAVIEGAVHIADLHGCDHLDLVRRPEVADLCARYLP
ncbi:MAG TPA: alpha/beta fold hydrolase [Thermaerobacter sp.]